MPDESPTVPAPEFLSSWPYDRTWPRRKRLLWIAESARLWRSMIPGVWRYSDDSYPANRLLDVRFRMDQLSGAVQKVSEIRKAALANLPKAVTGPLKALREGFTAHLSATEIDALLEDLIVIENEALGLATAADAGEPMANDAPVTAHPTNRLIGIVQSCNVLMNCYRSAADERWAQRDTIHRLKIDTPTNSDFQQMELSKLNHIENMCQHYHQQTCQLTEAMRLTMPDLLLKCRVLKLYPDPFFSDRVFDWDAMEGELKRVQLEARLQLDEPAPAPGATPLPENAKPAADPVLDEIDVKILKALAKCPYALMLEDLAQNVSGATRDTCSDHLKDTLIPSGYAIKKGKRKGVAITQSGRDRLNRKLD